MSEPPPPPFQTSPSEQAEEDLDRQPQLTTGANPVVLLAPNEVRRLLEMGQNQAIDLHGRRENLTVRVSLIPPDTVRIEDVAPGDIVPEGAILV